MDFRRVLILAGIFLAATLVLYLSGIHRQSRQTRIYMAKMWYRPDGELAQATKYFREACPDIVVTRDRRRADYSVGAMWTTKWTVIVDREGLPLPFFLKADSQDALESFRQSCAAMRDDSRERMDFDSYTESLPVGRYLLQSPSPDHVFLLDTRTGAVWQLRQVGDSEEFDRMSVDGLHSASPWLERAPKNPPNVPGDPKTPVATH